MHSQIRMLGSTQLHGGVGVAPADPQGSRFGFHSGFPIGFLGSNLREVLPCWGPEPHPGSLLGPSLNDGLKKGPSKTHRSGRSHVCLRTGPAWRQPREGLQKQLLNSLHSRPSTDSAPAPSALGHPGPFQGSAPSPPPFPALGLGFPGGGGDTHALPCVSCLLGSVPGETPRSRHPQLPKHLPARTPTEERRRALGSGAVTPTSLLCPAAQRQALPSFRVRFQWVLQRPFPTRDSWTSPPSLP